MSSFIDGINSVEIYSSNLDGSDETRLTNFSNNGTLRNQAIDLTFNSDSSKIIFVYSSRIFTGPVPFDGKIMSMNLDGSEIEQLSSNFGIGNYEPILLPGGQKLVYWKSIYHAPNIYLRQLFVGNIDGSNIQQLTTSASDGNFIYSPSINFSNNTIVYKCEVNPAIHTNVSGVYSMNFDGSNKQLLVTSNFHIGTPRVSKDGSTITYMKDVNGQSEIFLMNVDGSNIRQLTNFSNNGSLQKYSKWPSFSGDGFVYFTSNESGISQICKIKADGTEFNQLTTSNGNEKFNAIVKQ